ncbi:MAG: bifunctional protein-serine/threonine kinase/phosphatase [Rhodocyclaceae bacterium]
MSATLVLSVGQYSDKGRKPANQDFHAFCAPPEPQLSEKGIAIALADGISSSEVSHIASASAVRSFLDDYYCTSEAWSVKTAAERVLQANNSWLYSQTRQSAFRYDANRGYVCTFSALVIKSATAHVFHVGDSRVHHLRNGTLEQLTEDHRQIVGEERVSHLSRALGASQRLEVDYNSLALEPGDVFLLTTDGVHEYVSPVQMLELVTQHAADLDAVAAAIAKLALAQGSDDNLTVQVVRVDSLPARNTAELRQQWSELPPAPIPEARSVLDGYRIIRGLHASHRSHIFLAEDEESGERVVLKVPAIDLRNEPVYLERFMLEEWIARRLNSAHVLKAWPSTRTRSSLYVVTEYIEGKTLAQWMIDNPRPDIETVRGIVEQIAAGLLAFHRMEMLHQDLQPKNVMIDAQGTVKIIDFGSTRVAGLAELDRTGQPEPVLGMVQYAAPEYFIGEPGTPRSDLFALAVLTYQMLSGRLPYGAELAKARTRAAQKKLRYSSVLDEHREIPAWIDPVLEKALHPDPYQRYEVLSEFLYDLRHPNNALLGKGPPPLLERNPLLFWQVLSAALLIAVLALAATHPVFKSQRAATTSTTR